jgi:hypothetical protein
MAQPAFEKTVRYSGGIYELDCRSRTEVSRLITSRLSEMSTNAIAGLEKTVSRAPTHREAIPARASLSKTVKMTVDLADTKALVAAESTRAPKARKSD